MRQALRTAIIAVALATLVMVGRAAETGGPDPFPRLDDVPQELRLPMDAKITVGKDGEYQYDGKARYIIGNCYLPSAARGLVPTTGYPPELKWIYEKTLDYEGLQRIGCDIGGNSVPSTWLRKYLPDYDGSPSWSPEEIATAQRIIKESRLPMYVDFSCFPWVHGAAAYFKKWRSAVPEETFNSGGWSGEGNHWMSYSAGHPAGRQMWLDMWKSGAEFLRDAGGRALFYELLNEPAYNDKSNYNRAEFARRMEKKFGDITKLNAAWGAKYASFEEMAKFPRETDNLGLCVEWGKFMEDLVVELCAEGVKAIKEIDSSPEAGFCVQGMNRWRELPRENINLYKLSKVLNTTSTTTGGGDWLQARFLKSISRGKPIRDGETYMGHTRASFRDKLWLQMARGINCSCIFQWDKRGWDWKPKSSADGGKAVAEKFPYMLLNPYGVPTNALLGIMDAKREMFKIGDLFFPRRRGFDAQVALLVSFPTERLARATGEPCHDFVMQYGRALEYGGFEYDVILEEQMADEDRQKEYHVIVAAGANAIYNATAAKLQSYVENGGTLILAQEAMATDEYGKPNAFGKWLGLTLGESAKGESVSVGYQGENFNAKPYKKVVASPAWKTLLAAPDGAPVLLERPVGKGKIVYLAARFSEPELLRLNRLLLAERQIAPVVTVTDAEGNLVYGVETHVARNAQGAGVFFVTSRPQLVFVDARGVFGNLPQVAEPFNDLGGRRLTPGADGRYPLYLTANARAVLVAGTEEGLAARFGALPSVSADKARTEGERRLREEMEKQQKAQAQKSGGFVFKMNKALAKPLDLREQANRSFEDRVAGDGKGGWTDQGDNCLRGMEWGTHEWCGVPFEIIRWDHNADRACVVLKSQRLANLPLEAKGIQVGEKVKALYFLHACSWAAPGMVMAYVLHHADGGETRLPVRCGIEIEDWWHPKSKTGLIAAPVPISGHGLFIWRWENPQPEKAVTTIDVVSANGNSIPIVVAITAEIYDPDATVSVPLTGWQAKGWGGCQAVPGDDGSLRLALGEKAVHWCGVTLAGRKIALPAGKFTNGRLRFRINGSNDEWGKQVGGQKLQVKLEGTDAAGKTLTAQTYLPIHQYIDGDRVDGDPNTWQEVNVPLKRLYLGDCVTLTKISFQYQDIGDRRVGAIIKDMEIVR